MAAVLVSMGSHLSSAAAATCAPSCATVLASGCALSTAVFGNPGRGKLTLHLVALVSPPSLCWIATAPFISFDGEKGVKLEMKRVAAFAEVDDDAGSLFDYDVDRVRVRRSCFAAAGSGEGAVLSRGVATVGADLSRRQPPGGAASVVLDATDC